MSETHEHKLADGTPVTLGMRVKDYDAKYGVIVADGYWGERNAEELAGDHKLVNGTCESWFRVLRDDDTMSSMDCSRMVAEGGRYDR